MSLFDWFSGLFSSRSDEENNNSENNSDSDDGESVAALQNTYEETETQDQVNSELRVQDERKIESDSADTDKQHGKNEV